MYVIYSKPGCTFCDQSKAYLGAKGIAYEERIIDVGQEKLAGIRYVSIAHLKERVPGVKTVPQIFFNEDLVGGYDALKKHVESK